MMKIKEDPRIGRHSFVYKIRVEMIIGESNKDLLKRFIREDTKRYLKENGVKGLIECLSNVYKFEKEPYLKHLKIMFIFL